MVRVPTDLVGQQATQAVTELSNLGLHPVTKTDQNSNKPAGTVISVSPTAGTQVQPNSTVTLTISGGSSPVPPVTGLQLNSAIALLTQDGFKVNAQQVAGPAGTTPGLVWNQNPQQGTNEPPNFVVTIFYQPQAAPSTPASSSPSSSPSVPATGSPPPNGH
jgi:serine/threonine-protein kinase